MQNDRQLQSAVISFVSTVRDSEPRGEQSEIGLGTLISQKKASLPSMIDYKRVPGTSESMRRSEEADGMYSIETQTHARGRSSRIRVLPPVLQWPPGPNPPHPLLSRPNLLMLLIHSG